MRTLALMAAAVLADTGVNPCDNVTARLGIPQVQLQTSEPELTEWLQQNGLPVQSLKVSKWDADTHQHACINSTACWSLADIPLGCNAPNAGTTPQSL